MKTPIQPMNAYNDTSNAFVLDKDAKGQFTRSIENFEKIIKDDEEFDSLRFNLLTYSPERLIDGKAKLWTDADDSWARYYIEKEYGILSRNNLDDALRIVFNERAYHPVKNEIEKFEWDGVNRIETLLIKWLKCEENAYTREVSRLIFAGGIHRLYNAGCKFDNVPVLIGIKQGEGKSTFVRWLALEDEFYCEVTEIDGQKGMEAIEGAFICEIGELLAFTKVKDVEAVKSYITRQADKYRRPFDRRVSIHQRQCIFIGTTNKSQFLTDKTGNRRFLPLKVHSTGYALFDNEAAIRADIQQCWAEAKARFDKGEMPPYPDRNLLEIITMHQEGAAEDDYREGLIKEYIENKEEVCIFELWKNALKNTYANPTKKDSNELSSIMQKIDGWERAGNKRTAEFGLQRIWKNTLPFGEGEIIDVLTI